VPVPGEALRCDEPSDGDKNAVKALFAQPLPKFEKKKSEDIEDALWRMRAEAAARNGLHIFDPRQVLAPYYDDAYKQMGNSIPLVSYQEMAAQFLGRYGVNLVQPTDTSVYRYGSLMSPFSNSMATGFEGLEVKRHYINLISNVAELPVELVRQVGLTEVVVVKIDDKNIAGMAETATKTANTGRFYIDPSKRMPINTFNHEFFHLWDAKQCKGNSLDKDPSFSAINPSGDRTYVGEKYAEVADKNPGLTISSVIFSKTAQALQEEWNKATLNPGYSKAQSKQYSNMYDALFSNAVTPRPYGLAAIAEDKAVFGEELLSPYAYDLGVFADRSPVAKEKAEYLLARMLQDDPRIVRYFNEVGNRQLS
jgi:hypothetical protein